MASTITRLWVFTLLIPFSGLRAQVAPTRTDATRQAAGSTDLKRRAAESFMNGQIKHVSDFIDRFNNAVKAENGSENALGALFNEDDPRLPGSGRQHHPYASQVDAFVQSVWAAKFIIPKRGTMSAVIGIKVRCDSTPDTLKLHLRKDYTTDSAAYWHIVRVIAPARLLEEKENARKMQTSGTHAELPPNANEVSFLPLLRGLNDYQSMAPFTHCMECRDTAWEKVESALQNGRMTTEAVVSNKIYLVARYWELELCEFIREKENSGWLISDLVEKTKP
ncbi:hypothetical protein [Dyadobacter fermentans]|uniref:hypothetical protein n=1 Tax=Dyadobacter fermentans TaxID=94254 RepID=UPI001CBF9101|nr:hypothetical protein [Dyadobacter fermentans]MBZ1361590.1 hypothetical protein [Dyadobacter fermentans]